VTIIGLMSALGQKADICIAKSDVRFTPNSDRESRHAAKSHVRFTPKSGHVQCKRACPLRANSGHGHVKQLRRLPDWSRCKPKDQVKKMGARNSSRLNAENSFFTLFAAEIGACTTADYFADSRYESRNLEKGSMPLCFFPCGPSFENIFYLTPCKCHT